MREQLEFSWHINVCSRKFVMDSSTLFGIAVYICDSISGSRADCYKNPGNKCRHTECWAKEMAEE